MTKLCGDSSRVKMAQLLMVNDLRHDEDAAVEPSMKGGDLGHYKREDTPIPLRK
jgi:hypothetical protein